MDNAQAITQTTKSPAISKLDRLLGKRTMGQRTVVALDHSGSMNEQADAPGERRIDALRGVVDSLRSKGIAFRQLVFGGDVMWSDVIPEPYGGTPMAEALRFCQRISADHVIIVSDGQPDSREATERAAQELGAKIDVFYVGPSTDSHTKAWFESLAKNNGGQCSAVSFAELERGVIAALGAGAQDAPPAESKPIAL